MNIKSLLTTVGLTLALSLGAITTSAIAAPTGDSARPVLLTQKPGENKKPPSFLFVVQAKEAELEPVDNDQHRYTLTMQLNDDNVGNIIEFSDRPERIVNMMKAKQLHDLWGEGENSFKADPPNAVLSASGFDARIVILKSMTIDDGKLTFTLQTDPSKLSIQQNAKLKDLIITIDSRKQLCYDVCKGIHCDHAVSKEDKAKCLYCHRCMHGS